MYDDPDTVELYDVSGKSNKLSTLNHPIDLEFLDMIESLKLKSVLDLGCGAGAFYHLLKARKLDIEYFGYDLSPAQIERARQRFDDRFAVRDISKITRAEFSRYGAVHAYSVFSFMGLKDQIRTMRRILKSGAHLLARTGCTVPDINYAPQSSFRHYGQMAEDGRELMTAITFPYRSTLARLIRGTGHRVTFTERPYKATRALNNSGKGGAALANKNQIKRIRDDPHNCFVPTTKLLIAKISPIDWSPQRQYDKKEYEALLNRQ